jgi:hypothetical protein
MSKDKQDTPHKWRALVQWCVVMSARCSGYGMGVLTHGESLFCQA